jgi:mycothiol synthase
MGAAPDPAPDPAPDHVPAGSLRISRRDRLEAEELAAALDLIQAVADADGVSPVSEHVLLHLRHGGDREARDLLGHLGDTLVGYAHLDVTDRVEGPSAELAVHPGYRRRGIGSVLVDSLEAASPDGRLRLWAHGRHADASALARSRGYVEERVLWQLRRSLLSRLPDAPLPAGIRLRPFVPGRDEQAWIAVNNRAFAEHPDQGGWTIADLRVREAEPWFDPSGFLLAERAADGVLVGFHWTKVHGGAADGRHDHGPIGEVYVLGIDPLAQHSGLGAALTVAGLRHLRGLGLSQVMLYVDESNAAAVRLYQRTGFTEWDVDVQYRRAASG